MSISLAVTFVYCVETAKNRPYLRWNANSKLYLSFRVVTFSLTLSDLEWLSKIFNDTKHRAWPLCDSWPCSLTRIMHIGIDVLKMVENQTSVLTFGSSCILLLFTVIRYWSCFLCQVPVFVSLSSVVLISIASAVQSMIVLQQDARRFTSVCRWLQIESVKPSLQQ